MHGSLAKARREKERVRRQRNVDKLDGKVRGLLPTTVLIWNVDSTRCGSASLQEATKERAKGWSTDQIPGSVNIQKIQDDVIELWNVVNPSMRSVRSKRTASKLNLAGHDTFPTAFVVIKTQ
jgi:hypothetical protein